MNNESKFLTVSEINKYLAYKFEIDTNLQEVYLQGEISNFKYSGKHCYFSLKDQEAEIQAMFFYPSNLGLRFQPVDGMHVQVVGKIQLYQKRGTYAIIIQKMAQAGIGLLYQEFLDLKEKLQKEGLFDESKKLKLPEYPEKVAVITAPTGEAIQDIVSTFRRRFPLTQITLYPALVQGKDAPKDLMRALQLVYRDHDADAIIIGRGGGSFEDLSCFNDEQLARLLFASPIPTVSAVGHEGDYTICDFVASFRAPTPTGAAMKLTKDKADIIEQLVHYSKRLKADITSKLTNAYEKWKHLHQSYGLHDFEKVIQPITSRFEYIQLHLSKQSPNQIVERLENNLHHFNIQFNNLYNDRIKQATYQYEKLAIQLVPGLIIRQIEAKEKDVQIKHNAVMQHTENILQRFGTHFQSVTDKLVILNPFHMMDKGYSIVYKNNTIVSSIQDVEIDDPIDVQLRDGKISAIIKHISH